jgi:S-(hydroxymethyl)glutathione dehydrogenase / alcohol dehydrogenase
VKAVAAIFTGKGEPQVVDEVTLGPPARDEVLVRMEASGICRSDLSFAGGTWPSVLPIVLGHEGSGVIEAVGPGVGEDRVGEHVVLTFAPPCGRCRPCLEGRANLCVAADACMERGTMPDGTTRWTWQGRPLHHLALVSSFATHAVVPAAAAIPITSRLDLATASLLGCGVTTGIMSVTNRAAVRPGESVAVFGCGGVGLSSVQGARLVSAHPIIAVDPQESKRALALRLGASHVVDPSQTDPAALIRELTGGGADYAFEALGSPEVGRQAFDSVRRGGTTVLIGQPAIGVNVELPVYDLTQYEHTVLGSNLGGANPLLDVPRLAELAALGRIDLAAMTTHRFGLGDINEAIGAAASGTAGRVLLDLTGRP